MTGTSEVVALPGPMQLLPGTKQPLTPKTRARCRSKLRAHESRRKQNLWTCSRRSGASAHLTCLSLSRSALSQLSLSLSLPHFSLFLLSQVRRLSAERLRLAAPSSWSPSPWLPAVCERAERRKSPRHIQQKHSCASFTFPVFFVFFSFSVSLSLSLAPFLCRNPSLVLSPSLPYGCSRRHSVSGL